MASNASHRRGGSIGRSSEFQTHADHWSAPHASLHWTQFIGARYRPDDVRLPPVLDVVEMSSPPADRLATACRAGVRRTLAYLAAAPFVQARDASPVTLISTA